MRSRTRAWALMALVATAAVAAAGCSSKSSDSGISVANDGPDGGPGPYTFTTSVASDDGNYTWDLGDHLTVLYGQTVTHTYDLKSANLTVTLRVKQGGAPQSYTTSLLLGSGANTKPTMFLDAQTDWAVTGQPLTFSAARSVDPDGDALRFSWHCIRTGDAVRKPIHSHGTNLPPYTSPPAGTVTAYKANYTMPAPTMTLSGDLCAALATGSAPSTKATTISGTFEKSGIYEMILVGTDGAHPTSSGSYTFYVTPPNERPDPLQHFTFNATLKVGTGGESGVSLEPTCEQVPQDSPAPCDAYTGTFALPLAASTGWMNVTYSQPPNAPAGGVNVVKCDLDQGEAPIAKTEGDSPQHVDIPGRSLGATSYTVTCTLAQGAESTFTADVYAKLIMDPMTVY